MARQASTLTHARVLELFDYDTSTGNLTWRQSTSNRIRVGELAGSVASNGRRYVHIDGEAHMVHRLVWLLHKYEFPRFNLAPSDGNYLNTRIENLIERTPRETIKSGGLRSTNKTGVKGVTWDAAKKSYVVFAYIDGRSIFHSHHKTLEAATIAAKEAEQGYLPTPEQRKASHDRLIARNRLWGKMVKWCKGLHRWESVDQFLHEVGEPPHDASRLVASDPMKPIGPGNFQWTALGADHRSGDAQRVARARNEDFDRYRDGHMRRKHKSSNRAFVEKLLEQKGVCAICSNPETAMDKSGRVRQLHQDHDHKTGALRGLLCTCCNTALGHMKEDIDRLNSMIRYIEKCSGKQADNVVPINSALAFGA